MPEPIMYYTLHSSDVQERVLSVYIASVRKGRMRSGWNCTETTQTHTQTHPPLRFTAAACVCTGVAHMVANMSSIQFQSFIKMFFITFVILKIYNLNVCYYNIMFWPYCYSSITKDFTIILYLYNNYIFDHKVIVFLKCCP